MTQKTLGDGGHRWGLGFLHSKLACISRGAAGSPSGHPLLEAEHADVRSSLKSSNGGIYGSYMEASQRVYFRS